MKKIILTAFTIGVAVFGVQAQQAIQEGASISPKSAQQSLNDIDRQFFIENKGQWPEEVLYLTQMGGVNTWITTKGMLYEFYKTEEMKRKDRFDSAPDKFEAVTYKRWGHRVAYKLMGNNQNVSTEGSQKQAGYYNYLIGNDRSKHASNVGLYKEAFVREVYDGIDMRYYFDKGSLRYDYIVHPGADPGQIQFTFEGSEKTYLNENGELVFTTCFGEVKNAELYCYQEQDKKPVNSIFTKQGESWTIDLEDYDKNQVLVIDPLVYSTYIGGSNSEFGMAIAIDNPGNAYITGHTLSANYDITPGVFQTTIQGQNDVFVSKLNTTGTALIYSTFMGGNNIDLSVSITLDASNNAYIVGHTTSTDFDITGGAYQTTPGGGRDVFVSKLNATGTALIYSTYIGGASDDMGLAIAIDASNDVYITGYTTSSNYPSTSGAFQTTNEGNEDVFVTKLNNTGSALVYSTYIGGSWKDEGNSIAVDASGDAYVTGYTVSPFFDVTTGAFKTTHTGGLDVFAAKLNATGTALLYSTFIGGSNDDLGYAMTIDELGNAYITGHTFSTNYDVTPGAFDETHEGNEDVFITKLNAAGTALIYSTYIGSSSSDVGESIAVDASGNTYITGTTLHTPSANFPVTSGAFQTTYSGGHDVFVTKLNTLGTILMYSTLIGGSTTDIGSSLALDASENVYITGQSRSSTYPITAGVFQTIHAGEGEVFVTKLCLPDVIPISASATTICQGAPVTLTASGSSGYTWTSSTGQTYTGNQIMVGPSTTTTYTVTDNNTPCESQGSITITVHPTPNFNLGSNIVLCAGDPFPTICPTGSFGKGTSFSWSGPGIAPGTVTTGCYQPTQYGYYCLTVTGPTGCSTTKCINVSEHPNSSYDPEYTLTVSCFSGSNVTITPTFDPLPAGMSELVLVEIQNGPAWNIIDIDNDFDISNVTFLQGEVYRIRRRVWGPCFPLQEIIHTASCTAGRRNGEVLIHVDGTELLETVNYSIFPNPNNGHFNIELTNTKEDALIEVYDLMGKQILHSEVNEPTMSIDISDQPKGVYVLKITVGQEVFNERVVRQ